MTNENAEVDPFEGYSPLPGLEHLGRHITDANGMPSGSPANFEATRGKGGTYIPSEEDKAKAVELLINDPSLGGIAIDTIAAGQAPADHPWAADSHD